MMVATYDDKELLHLIYARCIFSYFHNHVLHEPSMLQTWRLQSMSLQAWTMFVSCCYDDMHVPIVS